jgi:hypothetical protein
MNIMKKQKFWTDEEIKYLIKNHKTKTLNDMSIELNRSNSSIINKSHLLKLNLRVNRMCDLTNLINESNEAYYWLGFLMADGHFSKNGQIQINLSEKDLQHLIKFSKFVKYRKVLSKPNLYVSDNRVTPLLCEKYGLVNNKTYNPPNIDNINGDKLFSLIIGFIDGDGSISDKGYLRIKVHSTWTNVIKKMMEHLVGNGNFSILLDKHNLVIGCINKIELMKKIKQKIIDLDISFLERKWVRVNLNKLSKNEKRMKLDNECFKLFKNGLNVKETIEKTNLSSTFVYSSYKKYIKKETKNVIC